MDRARIAAWNATAAEVLSRSAEATRIDDAQLLERARDLRWRAASGAPLLSLLPEAFVLVRESARRVLGFQHYPVQLLGGVALAHGFVAEMQTGEGKTLTATLPLFLHALQGKGCHAVTSNDYLARRDAAQMEPLFARLGLTVGCLQSGMPDESRRGAYRRDVTYSTASELGFDFLRDRLRSAAGNDDNFRACPFGTSLTGASPVQRGHHFALIDEADSTLIDEARTPLIIGTTVPNDAVGVALVRWCSRVAPDLSEPADYTWSPDERAARLTETGCRRILLHRKPSLLATADTSRILTAIEQALTAQRGFQRDRDYVVVRGEVSIVDESTGRMMEGRKWQEGLHQAIEAREELPITTATGQAARITMQEFFRRYTHLAGMTGTALSVRGELSRAYRLKVATIPTHRPCRRQASPTRIFETALARNLAVAEAVAEVRSSGRPVLIGTPSVNASESLSAALAARGIAHEVLNARSHEQEAAIVAEAGQPGRVTIATNMAGRGTDIHLHADVRAAGGLHVIATEMHSAGRIDRQLIGRCARQGDPGSYQFFLSLDDELLQCLAPEAWLRLKDRAWPDGIGELPATWIRVFQQAQRHLENLHARERTLLLKTARQRTRAWERMGLDSFLELSE